MKKQKQDEERITLTYTRSHVVKAVIAVLNFLVCLIVLVYDMLSAEIPFIVENTIFTFVWMFSIMLLRREFLKIGQTSCALLTLWVFLLFTPTLVLVVVMLNNAQFSSFRTISTLIKLVLNFFLVLFTLIRRVDIGDIYSRTSSVYNQMVKSYFLEDESLENPEQVWDKWDKLAEESTSVVERENIKSMSIKATELKETSHCKVDFYIIEVCYGKTKDLKRLVLRRFREFLVLFKDLKSAYPELVFPDFPKLLPNREQTTPAVLSERSQAFTQLLDVILKNKLNTVLLSKFVSNKSEGEIAFPDHKLRTFSCIQEIPLDVQLNKAFRKSSRLVTQANYEVIVTSGKYCIRNQHTFAEFKDLRKKMLKRNSKIEELPASNLLKSSANPEVVKERKGKLRMFLQKLVNDPEMKADNSLIGFLKLDRIYFAEIVE